MTSTLILAKIPITSWAFWTTLMTAEIPMIICFIVAWKEVYEETLMSNDPYITSDGLFACLCAGTFIYLALGHLIPEALQLGHAHTHDYSTTAQTTDPEGQQAEKELMIPAEQSPREILFQKLAIYVAIGLGWVTFALFAIAPEGGNDDSTAVMM